eukprot:m.450886 g.450886  ORF g.450886 m.450886 type:complete len:949 (-) comp21521_c0_seq1:46-2892(-)
MFPVHVDLDNAGIVATVTTLLDGFHATVNKKTSTEIHAGVADLAPLYDLLEEFLSTGSTDKSRTATEVQSQRGQVLDCLLARSRCARDIRIKRRSSTPHTSSSTPAHSAQGVLFYALTSESILETLHIGPNEWTSAHRILRATIAGKVPEESDVADLCAWLAKDAGLAPRVPAFVEIARAVLRYLLLHNAVRTEQRAQVVQVLLDAAQRHGPPCTRCATQSLAELARRSATGATRSGRHGGRGRKNMSAASVPTKIRVSNTKECTDDGTTSGTVSATNGILGKSNDSTEALDETSIADDSTDTASGSDDKARDSIHTAAESKRGGTHHIPLTVSASNNIATTKDVTEDSTHTTAASGDTVTSKDTTVCAPGDIVTADVTTSVATAFNLAVTTTETTVGASDDTVAADNGSCNATISDSSVAAIDTTVRTSDDALTTGVSNNTTATSEETSTTADVVPRVLDDTVTSDVNNETTATSNDPIVENDTAVGHSTTESDSNTTTTSHDTMTTKSCTATIPECASSVETVDTVKAENARAKPTAASTQPVGATTAPNVELVNSTENAVACSVHTPPTPHRPATSKKNRESHRTSSGAAPFVGRTRSYAAAIGNTSTAADNTTDAISQGTREPTTPRPAVDLTPATGANSAAPELGSGFPMLSGNAAAAATSHEPKTPTGTTSAAHAMPSQHLTTKQSESQTAPVSTDTNEDQDPCVYSDDVSLEAAMACPPPPSSDEDSDDEHDSNPLPDAETRGNNHAVAETRGGSRVDSATTSAPQHMLSTPWTLWHIDPTRYQRPDFDYNTMYEPSLKEVGRMNSIESFWELSRCLAVPPRGSMHHMFVMRKDWAPMMESAVLQPACGRLKWECTASDAAHVFWNAILLVVGDVWGPALQTSGAGQVCGFEWRSRGTQHRFAVWYHHSTNTASTETIVKEHFAKAFDFDSVVDRWVHSKR